MPDQPQSGRSIDQLMLTPPGQPVVKYYELIPPATLPDGAEGGSTTLSPDGKTFVMFTPAGVTVYRRVEETFVVAGEVRFDQVETIDHTVTLTSGDGVTVSVPHPGGGLSVAQIEAHDDSIHVTTYPSPGKRVDVVDGWMR